MGVGVGGGVFWRSRQNVCVCVCVCECVCLGTHMARSGHVIYFRILMSLWSLPLKKTPCWDNTHTQTHIIVAFLSIHCSAGHIYACMHTHKHTHTNIIHTHRHTPGCLIYFNYHQIHRDPITKIQGYLSFCVHPKRLIKFSCKDKIIWYNTNVFSFS